jgi:hypothetical protein
MIRILIAAINFFSERRDKSLLLEGVEEKIEDITNKLYVVLAALIKGNRANCSNFAQTARLNWLVNRLQSQQASRGVLEVLHSVLVDSPEVLNMITESHILASKLEKKIKMMKYFILLSKLSDYLIEMVGILKYLMYFVRFVLIMV